MHNSLKLSFTDIQGLCLNFVDWKSFLESNSTDIAALCETNLDDSIDSGNFSVWGCLPVIWKDSSAHIYAWPCSLCWRKGFLLHGTSLYKTLQILTYVLNWLHFTQCLISFSSIDQLICLYAQFLILFYLTLLRFSQSTHLLMCLSLETLTSIIRTG